MLSVLEVLGLFPVFPLELMGLILLGLFPVFQLTLLGFILLGLFPSGTLSCFYLLRSEQVKL